MAFRGMMQSMAQSLALPLVAMALTTGCYIETIDDQHRMPVAGEPNRLPLRGEGSCHLDLSKGCFDGNVISMQDFFIGDKSFLNADDLATRFAELVAIQDEDGNALVAGTDFALTLESNLGNHAYVREFTYDLTGRTARRDQVRDDGNFSINDLPEGTYDLRVQRPVKFVVSKEVERDPTSPDDRPTIEVQKKTYCATIYADTVIEIRKGERAWESFDNFQLHVTDHECGAGATRTTLTL